jgi:CrcB protein
VADLPLLTAVAAGGVLGALARYGTGELLRQHPGGFPLATFGINVAGCLAIGVLMGLTEDRIVHRLVRPFVGTGVLGGFTTFSTYAVESRGLFADQPVTALLYLFGTLLAAVLAAWAGTALARPR